MNFESEREISPWSAESQESSQQLFQDLSPPTVPREIPQGPLQIPEQFLKPQDRGQEKTEEQRKARPTEVQIADILLKNDDFNFGVKRERTLAIFEEALRSSQRDLNQLVNRINAELKKRGSSLRIEAQCEQEETIEHIPPPPDAQTFPKSQHYRVTKNVAILKVNNRFGEVEDEARLAVTVKTVPVGLFEREVEALKPENNTKPQKR